MDEGINNMTVGYNTIWISRIIKCQQIQSDIPQGNLFSKGKVVHLLMGIMKNFIELLLRLDHCKMM